MLCNNFLQDVYYNPHTSNKRRFLYVSILLYLLIFVSFSTTAFSIEVYKIETVGQLVTPNMISFSGYNTYSYISSISSPYSYSTNYNNVYGGHINLVPDYEYYEKFEQITLCKKNNGDWISLSKEVNKSKFFPNTYPTVTGGSNETYSIRYSLSPQGIFTATNNKKISESAAGPGSGINGDTEDGSWAGSISVVKNTIFSVNLNTGEGSYSKDSLYQEQRSRTSTMERFNRDTGKNELIEFTNTNEKRTQYSGRDKFPENSDLSRMGFVKQNFVENNQPQDCNLQSPLFLDFNKGKQPITAKEVIRNKYANLATGIATDGISLGLIIFEAVPEDKIVFHLNEQNKTYGTLHSFSNVYENIINNFGELQVNAEYIDVDGTSYAVALYRAPETSISTIEKAQNDQPLEIEILQDNMPVKVLNISLKAPPLMAVHGIWSDKSAWDKFIRYLYWHLETRPGGLPEVVHGYPSAAFKAASYKDVNDHAFDSKEIQGMYKTEIEGVLNTARKKGVIATQVDIVAHSMGGLISRHYATKEHYRDKRNYQKGDINRLITVATPHKGSDFANWLSRNKANTLETKIVYNKYGASKIVPETILAGSLAAAKLSVPLKENTLADFMRFAQNKDITKGGVDGLRRNTINANKLADTSILKFRAIKAERPSLTCTVAGLNSALALFDEKALPDHDDVVSVLKETQYGKSDGIVPGDSSIPSTAGSTPSDYAIFKGLIHSSFSCPQDNGITESLEVHKKISCWLREDTSPYCVSLGKPGISTQSTVQAASITAQATAPFSEADLWALEEIDSGIVDLSPANGSTIAATKETIATISSTQKTITRVITYSNGVVNDLTSAPFKFAISTNTFDELVLITIVLFDDNTYAVKSASYSVDLPGELVFIEVPDKRDLQFSGSVFEINPIAYYSQSGHGIDISDLAIYTIGSGTESVVKVSPNGVVTATGVGEDVVNVSYDGKTVPVEVHVKYEMDTDNDGLPDGYENRYSFLDPNNNADGAYDQDEDNLSNLMEYKIGTNPNNSDTDGDGIKDSDDVDPLHADPSIVYDLEEYFPLMPEQSWSYYYEQGEAWTTMRGETRIAHGNYAIYDGVWMLERFHYKPEYESGNLPLSTSYYSQDEQYIYAHGSQRPLAPYEPPMKTQYTPPIKAFKRHLAIGESWKVSSKLTDTFGTEATIMFTKKLERIESITVGIGTFHGCLKLSTTYPDGRVSQSWYAKGIGRVKTRQDNQSEGSWYTSELTSYTYILDDDNDGLSNTYEDKYIFLNPNNSSDAGKDQDNDGLSNLKEYQAGSDPAMKDTDRDGLSDRYELDNNLDLMDGICPSWICGGRGSWRHAIPLRNKH